MIKKRLWGTIGHWKINFHPKTIEPVETSAQPVKEPEPEVIPPEPKEEIEITTFKGRFGTSDSRNNASSYPFFTNFSGEMTFNADIKAGTAKCSFTVTGNLNQKSKSGSISGPTNAKSTECFGYKTPDKWVLSGKISGTEPKASFSSSSAASAGAGKVGGSYSGADFGFLGDIKGNKFEAYLSINRGVFRNSTGQAIYVTLQKK